MFKVKAKDVNIKKELIAKLNIVETKDYQYVLTPDQECVEIDKINIVFPLDNLEEVSKIIDGIVLGADFYVNGEGPEGLVRLNTKDIEYFEALGNDVFAVVGKKRYIVQEKLYALEEILENKNFVRTSKSFLVNILKIEYIRPMFNYKLELFMSNKDRIDVNRTYVKSFKRKLNI